MANISDLIEQFLISALGNDESVEISRNSLAQHFACAPSQINYVLSTRFTVDNGFSTSSRRGGGGYILIEKIPLTPNDYLTKLVNEIIGDEISFSRAIRIVEKLENEDIISVREGDIMLAGMCDKALASPLMIKDKLRAQIFKQMILEVIKDM